MAKLKITETVLRDAHQSLLATRMSMDDMRPILPEIDKIGFYSAECWGGATFDSCIRFLNEDPWERLRILRKEMPNTKLQMLFRGQNMLGYRHYADDLVEYFVQKSIANGIDIIRIFDALNDIRNLETAINTTAGSNVKIGAENVHFEKSGAFTGEISADMLVELGVEYVVIGHSERRQYFGETDETVNKRTKAALAAGLKPIVCVGELLWERECNITEEVIARQIKLDLYDVSAEDVKKTVIAYEPVWAIGTGKTATADQAEEVCGFIRDTLAKIYDQATADAVTIQYGGSMNAGNAAELLSKPNVDGGLIGGASLKAADFNTIVQAAVEG